MPTGVPGSSSLTWPDYAVLSLVLACLIAIGVRFTREQRATVYFFLARRRVPWWAACLSFLATEISAVTIISVPATAYSENWQYFQFFVGSSLAKFAVAFLFIPAFYAYNGPTIYEFLGYRFGRATQFTGSIFFFVTRLLGSGVRLMAACLAVSILIGWPLAPTIALLRALRRRAHPLHRRRRREGGGLDQRLPGADLPRGGRRDAGLPPRPDRRRPGGGIRHCRRGRAALPHQLGAGAGRPRFLGAGSDRSKHRLAGGAKGAGGLGGGLRDRPRSHAAAPDGGDPPAEPADVDADPAGNARHPHHLPRARSRALHLLRPAPEPAGAAPRRHLPPLHRVRHAGGAAGAHALGDRAGLHRLAPGVACRLLRHRHLPPNAGEGRDGAPLPARRAAQRDRLRPDPGPPGLRILLLRQDPVAGLQDRGGDLRLAPRRLPAGAPLDACRQPCQRRRDGDDGPGEPGSLDPLRDGGAAARLELARDLGDGGDHPPRVVPGSVARRNPLTLPSPPVGGGATGRGGWGRKPGGG